MNRISGTLNRKSWVIPYSDQPLDFWQALDRDLGHAVREVYFPVDLAILGTGRPPLPDDHLARFLADAPQEKSVLLNATTLPAPVHVVAPRVDPHHDQGSSGAIDFGG